MIWKVWIKQGGGNSYTWGLVHNNAWDRRSEPVCYDLSKPDCYDLFAAIQFQTLFLCNPRIIPVAAPVPAPILLSPHMTAVLAFTHDSSSSYFGSLALLPWFSIQIWSHVPGSHSPHCHTFRFQPPVPLSIVSASVSTVIHAFIDQCKFQVFLPIFRSDYVGTANRDDAASLHATVQSLKKYSMPFRNPTSGQPMD